MSFSLDVSVVVTVMLMCLTALPLFMFIMGEMLFTCLHASMLKWIMLHGSICNVVEYTVKPVMLATCLVTAFLQNPQNCIFGARRLFYDTVSGWNM